METITPIIATTLPDLTPERETLSKDVLTKFKVKINNYSGGLPVKNTEGKIIGIARGAKMDLRNQLIATLDIDTDKVDKTLEYFFVPSGGIIKKEKQGRCMVILNAEIDHILMTAFPKDQSLPPTRFKVEFKEGVHYFVKRHDELTPETVKEFSAMSVNVYVYYPLDFGKERDVIADATRLGIIKDYNGIGGEILPGFDIKALPESFDEFKNRIEEMWIQEATKISENPLENPTPEQLNG